jgi:hypothetical protein
MFSGRVEHVSRGFAQTENGIRHVALPAFPHELLTSLPSRIMFRLSDFGQARSWGVRIRIRKIDRRLAMPSREEISLSSGAFDALMKFL